MENSIKMDDLGGKPPIFGNSHMYTASDLEEVAKSCFCGLFLGPSAEVIYTLQLRTILQQLLQGSNKKHSKYRCWDATIAGWFL